MDDEVDKMGRKIVSALRRLLMANTMEALLTFLQQIGIQYSMVGQSKSKSGPIKFRATIYIQEGRGVPGEHSRTVREYRGGSDDSAKAAFCDCMARFLVQEKIDYHEYTATTRVGNG